MSALRREKTSQSIFSISRPRIRVGNNIISMVTLIEQLLAVFELKKYPASPEERED